MVAKVRFFPQKHGLAAVSFLFLKVSVSTEKLPNIFEKASTIEISWVTEVKNCIRRSILELVSTEKVQKYF